LYDGLDQLDELAKELPRTRKRLATGLRAIWRQARPFEGEGHWDKVLKRIYRLGGLSHAAFLRRRAVADILRYPEMAARVMDYVRCTGTAGAHLKIAASVWSHPEQIHPDVNLRVVESLLRLEPSPREVAPLRQLASRLLRKDQPMAGSEFLAAVAPLLVLRFGDARSKPLLKSVCGPKAERRTAREIRAAAVVLTGFGSEDFRFVRRAAAKLWQNDLAGVVRLVERILECKTVPKEFIGRLSCRLDSVAGRPFLDMRTLAAARLLALNNKRSIREWLSARTQQWRGKNLSLFDRRMLERLLP
jgi:hypothetical protein